MPLPSSSGTFARRPPPRNAARNRKSSPRPRPSMPRAPESSGRRLMAGSAREVDVIDNVPQDYPPTGASDRTTLHRATTLGRGSTTGERAPGEAGQRNKSATCRRRKEGFTLTPKKRPGPLLIFGSQPRPRNPFPVDTPHGLR